MKPGFLSRMMVQWFSELFHEKGVESSLNRTDWASEQPQYKCAGGQSESDRLPDSASRLQRV